jgi:translation initiation factor 2 beta subunit (eIF-2beta)/eIF-5
MKPEMTPEEIQSSEIPEFTKHYTKCLVCGASNMQTHSSILLAEGNFPLPLILIECTICGFIAPFDRLRPASSKAMKKTS